MKKYLALLLAVVMTLSLVACGEKNPNPAPDDVDNQDQQTEPVSDIWLPYNEDLSAKRVTLPVRMARSQAPATMPPKRALIFFRPAETLWMLQLRSPIRSVWSSRTPPALAAAVL